MVALVAYGALRGAAMAASLQLGRTGAVGHSIFLLVSIPVGDPHICPHHLGPQQDGLGKRIRANDFAREAVQMNWTAIIVFIALFGLVTVLGFLAAYWRRGDLDHPALILHSFPDWFAGVAFAAIGIRGLVPAAIMSIAASNLFTRNIYMRFINTDCTAKQETQNAKIVSLVVKCGALVFIIFLPLEYAIQLQLLGGIWISQTIPAVIIGLYTRWLNFAVSMVLSPLLNCVPATRGTDETATRDYCFDVVESVGSPAR